MVIATVRVCCEISFVKSPIERQNEIASPAYVFEVVKSLLKEPKAKFGVKMMSVIVDMASKLSVDE